MGDTSGASYAYERLEQERAGQGQGSTAPLDPVQLRQFLDGLDSYQATIPEEVTGFYLQQAGVTVIDQKIKKIMSLATEKLLANVIHDATQHGLLRTGGGEDGKNVLRMEDLVLSLKKYGVLKVKMTDEADGKAPPPPRPPSQQR